MPGNRAAPLRKRPSRKRWQASRQPGGQVVRTRGQADRHPADMQPVQAGRLPASQAPERLPLGMRAPRGPAADDHIYMMRWVCVCVCVRVRVYREYVCIYMCIYCIYIYIYRERERERYTYIYIYIYNDNNDNNDMI